MLNNTHQTQILTLFLTKHALNTLVKFHESASMLFYYGKFCIYLHFMLVHVTLLNGSLDRVCINNNIPDTLRNFFRVILKSSTACRLERNCFGQQEQLVRLNGVKVGHIQTLRLVNDISHQMITRSLKPLMFEIPGFLTSEECDHIIALAQDQGLFKSLTLGDELDNGDNEEEEIEQDLDSGQGCEEFFEKDDLNGDSVLSTDELRKSLHKSLDILLSDEDLHKMIQQLQMDKDEDGSISIQECQSINHLKLFRYINDIQKKHPHYRDRFSQQTWLDQSTPEDTVLQNLRERVMKLTQLPPLIIQESEELQVVHYTVRGHYHAHYDTSNGDENKDRPCCQKFSGTVGVDCRLCRFLTILYYLNDVTSGGETAFPVADNATFDEEVFAASGISNLSVHCKDANIVVKPRKGTAVMWYNHHVDDDTGLLGSADDYAYHGGCDVIKGHKWIANNWIDAVDKDS